jgi:hypothetical protein
VCNGSRLFSVSDFRKKPDFERVEQSGPELVKTIQERRPDNGHCKRLTESFKLAPAGCHYALCRV